MEVRVHHGRDVARREARHGERVDQRAPPRLVEALDAGMARSHARIDEQDAVRVADDEGLHDASLAGEWMAFGQRHVGEV
jgi:hypothetical protein